jgi:hypothetical protein
MHQVWHTIDRLIMLLGLAEAKAGIRGHRIQRGPIWFQCLATPHSSRDEGVQCVQRCLCNLEGQRLKPIAHEAAVSVNHPLSAAPNMQLHKCH